MNKQQKKERNVQIALGALDYNNLAEEGGANPYIGHLLMAWGDANWAVSTTFVYYHEAGRLLSSKIMEVIKDIQIKIASNCFSTHQDILDYVKDQLKDVSGHYETAIIDRYTDTDAPIFVIEKYGDDYQAAVNGHKWYVDTMVFNRPPKISKKILRGLRLKRKERNDS